MKKLLLTLFLLLSAATVIAAPPASQRLPWPGFTILQPTAADDGKVIAIDWDTKQVVMISLDPFSGLQPGDVDDVPVDGATTAPVSSNWAFDHVAAADPHTGYVQESAVDTTPANGSTDPINSDWAYDHTNAVAPHPSQTFAQFVSQTPWRLFYSNGSGDVTELGFGSAGESLLSAGASSAPYFGTPSSGPHDAVTLSADVNAFMSLSTQQLIMDSLSQNLVLATPSGGSGVMAPRALVDADIPDTITASNYVDKAMYNAYSVVVSDSDNTPFNFALDNNVLLGRGAAGIAAFPIGTGASNIVQLNGSGEFPAISAVNLTNIPLGAVSGILGIVSGGTGGSTALAGFDNIKQQATDAYAGVAEKATNAEVTTGSDDARYVSPAGLAFKLAAPGVIGGTTPGAGNFSTMNVGAGGFQVDADGDITALKSVTLTKASGQAGAMLMYEANLTDTDGAGFYGPLSLGPNSSYAGRMPNNRVSGSNYVQAWTSTGETGTGTPINPYVQQTSFVSLDSYLAKAGGTMTGMLATLASATGGAGIRIPPGVAPTSPVNGDFWLDSEGLKIYYNGVQGPFGSSSADVSGGSVSATGEAAGYTDGGGKTIGRTFFVPTGMNTSAKAKTFSDKADTVAELNEAQTFLQLQTFGAGVVIADGQSFTFDESAADPNDADVRMTGADGVLKLAAVNGANNETLTVDLDQIANTVVVGTDSGVVSVSFSAMDIVTTGVISGKIPTGEESTATTYNVTTAEARAGKFFLNTYAGTKTFVLPAAEAGMAVCVKNGQGVSQILRIDTDGTDYVVKSTGARTSAAGDYYGATADAKNQICVCAFNATDWYVTSEAGTWTEE